MIYRDRAHAAGLLAGRLRDLRGQNPLVLAIPRGGVTLGRILADELDGELDVVLVRKLRAPMQPELAIGAVDEEGEVIVGEAAHLLRVPREAFEAEVRRQRAVLADRRALYTPARPPVSPASRVVVVVDDGSATGSTMLAALRAVRRRKPRRLVAALAVVPAEVAPVIEREADRLEVLQAPEDFGAVGQFFEDFAQVSDEEVVAALEAAAGRSPP